MPFGLNIAPRIFTKLVNCVVKRLRIQGVLVVAISTTGCFRHLLESSAWRLYL